MQMKLTLRQLAVFEAVARLNSVTEAAAEIGLSQSAASSSIQDLEIALGVTLFQRRRRNIALNENGRRLQPQAQSILEIARDIEASNVKGGLAGILRIGASQTIGERLLPDLCSGFVREHPRVQIKLTVSASEARVIDDVDNLAVDVGFIEGVSMRQSLLVEPWIRDSLVIVAHPRHHAARTGTALGGLAGENWVLPPLGSATRHMFTQKYSSIVSKGAIVFESNSMEALKGAVKSGAGLACLSRMEVERELSRGEIAEIKVKGFKIKREFNIISRKDVYHGSVKSSFLAIARLVASR